MHKNIVYIDDEVDLCDLFAQIFATEEISITTFNDPDKAVGYINSNDIDLIFIDYRLPNTTGDDIAFKIKSKATKYIITGELEFIPKSDVKGVLNKPIDIAKINQIIASI